MVFTKILYMLCAPNAYPPPYNKKIEVLCDFIRTETCPKTAFMLLNLVAEGWIEEIFYSLDRAEIAPRVFKTIIEDEHRHVSEADLYREIGLPESSELAHKLSFLEEQLLSNIFLQYKYIYSISALIGGAETSKLIELLNKKHLKQLAKINLQPTENWKFFIKFNAELLPKIEDYSSKHSLCTMTSTRRLLMTQWSNPSDPTGTCLYNINVSALNYFSDKFSPQLLTPLMLQTFSATICDLDNLRQYLWHNLLYQTDSAYIGVVVNLAGCDDQLACIVFENCHLWPVKNLMSRIRSVMLMMIYCYKKRQALEEAYPHLKLLVAEASASHNNLTYKYPIPGAPFVTVSNIGAYGYEQAISPLRVNESLRFTFTEVDRRSLWSKTSNSFETQDVLPISSSGDHRFLDANIPLPKYTQLNFNKMLLQMQQDSKQDMPTGLVKKLDLVDGIEQLISRDLEFAYKVLLFLQTCWLDFHSLEDIFSKDLLEETITHYSL